MAIMTDARLDVPHPEWCSRRHCDVGRYQHATRHGSAPRTWKTRGDDVEITLSLERSDEHAVGQGTPGVMLGLYNTAACWPDGAPIYAEVFLHAADIDRLINELGRIRRAGGVA